MNCPKCLSTRITKDSLNRSGSQRYRCMDCKKKFTPCHSTKKPNRPCKGDRAMTGAERSRKFREERKKIAALVWLL